MVKGKTVVDENKRAEFIDLCVKEKISGNSGYADFIIQDHLNFECNIIEKYYTKNPKLYGIIRLDTDLRKEDGQEYDYKDYNQTFNILETKDQKVLVKFLNERNYH